MVSSTTKVQVGNDPPQSYPPTLRQVAYAFEWMNGETTPHFRARQKAGELLPHTKWEQCKIEGQADGVYDVTNSNGSEDIRTWVEGPWIDGFRHYLASSDATLVLEGYSYDLEVQKAAADIYSGFDALTFLTELRLTKDSLFKLKKRFVSFRRKWEKSRKHKPARKGEPTFASNWFAGLTPRDVSSWYLEWKYEWRLIYLDLVDLYDTVQKLDDSRQRFSVRKGYTDKTYSKEESIGADASGETTFTTVTNTSVSVRGSVVADIQPPDFQFNLAITAWERTTASFIFDWVVEIGTWLEALSFLVLQDQYTAAGGYKVTMSREVTSNFVPNPGWSGSRGQSGGSTLEYTSRIPTTVSLQPQAARVNFKGTVDHLLDLTAILKPGGSPKIPRRNG